MSQGETKGKIKNFPPKAYRQSVFSCQPPKFIVNMVKAQRLGGCASPLKEDNQYLQLGK